MGHKNPAAMFFANAAAGVASLGKGTPQAEDGQLDEFVRSGGAICPGRRRFQWLAVGLNEAGVISCLRISSKSARRFLPATRAASVTLPWVLLRILSM